MTDGVRLLAAQFDTSVEIFWERMEGLTDAEYLWDVSCVRSGPSAITGSTTTTSSAR